jgi:starch phosphorylase
MLLTHGNQYMHLADLRSQLEAARRLVELYADPDSWARKAGLRVAGLRKGSGYRAFAEYAASIWNA